MKECVVKPYIVNLTSNNQAREILNNRHNEIFREIDKSQYFRKYEGILFESKQIDNLNKGRQLIKSINDKYGKLVTKIIPSQNNKNYVIVNVKNLLPEVLEQIEQFKEIGDDFYMGDEYLRLQEEDITVKYQQAIATSNENLLELSDNQSLQEGLKWLNSVLPQANYELSKGLIDGLGKGSFNSIEDLIRFSIEYEDKGTVKHEALHKVLNSLPFEEREKILNEASKKFNIPIGKLLENKNLPDNIILPKEFEVRGNQQNITGNNISEKNEFNNLVEFTNEEKKTILTTFANKYKISEHQALEDINKALTSNKEETIEKLKECF